MPSNARRLAGLEGIQSIRVLIVEDDLQLAHRLRGSLSAAGFVADHAADGDNGCFMGLNGDYDSIVLDLGLPRIPGLELLRRWRAAGKAMPVLILSARDTWTERVEGLNAGADDYLGKPFHAAEVVARLRALMRRVSGITTSVLNHGGLAVDVAAGTVTADGKPVNVTAQELKVLTYLMQRAGRIVSQSDLTEHVYALSDLRDSNTIEVYVARLRKKLGRDAIRTIRGLGYRVG